ADRVADIMPGVRRHGQARNLLRIARAPLPVLAAAPRVRRGHSATCTKDNRRAPPPPCRLASHRAPPCLAPAPSIGTPPSPPSFPSLRPPSCVLRQCSPTCRTIGKTGSFLKTVGLGNRYSAPADIPSPGMLRAGRGLLPEAADAQRACLDRAREASHGVHFDGP